MSDRAARIGIAVLLSLWAALVLVEVSVKPHGEA